MPSRIEECEAVGDRLHHDALVVVILGAELRADLAKGGGRSWEAAEVVTGAKQAAIQAAAVNVTVTIIGKGNRVTPMGVELAVFGVAAKMDIGTVLIRVAI